MTTEMESKNWIYPPKLKIIKEEFISLTELAIQEDDKTPLMICGDTGSGKSAFIEIFKQHFLKNKKKAEIAHLNIATIPEKLIESTLFGLEKGSFTDATVSKKGIVDVADLLILEEIGELPSFIQAKLLTFIEDGIAYPVGANKPRPNTRRLPIVATTNKQQKDIRPDFYARFYKFNVPALHQRRTDVLHYFQFFAPETFQELRPWEIMSLVCYHWPGNVREIMTLAKEIKLAIKRRPTFHDEIILTDTDDNARRSGQITYEEMLERARAGDWKPDFVKNAEKEKKKLLKKIKEAKLSLKPCWSDFHDAMRSTTTNLEDKCTSFRRSLELNGVDVVFLEKALNTYGLGLDYRSQKTPLKDSDPENFSEHIQEGLTFFCSLFCKDQLSPRDLLSDRTDNRPIHIPYGPRWPDLNQKKLRKLATDCLRYIGIRLKGELPDPEAGIAAFFEAIGMHNPDPIPAPETKDAGEEKTLQTRDECLRSYYTGLLNYTGGNVSEATRISGDDKRTMYKYLKKYGLK